MLYVENMVGLNEYPEQIISNNNKIVHLLERTIIVSEYFGSPLSSFTTNKFTEHSLLKVFYQILKGLEVIQTNRFVNHNIEPAHILIDDDHNVKLFSYGLYYMTNNGRYVAFPIGYLTI